MMIRKNLFILMMIFHVLALPLYAHQESNPSDRNHLIIAISTSYPPFTMLNAEGNPSGMFVDLWNLWSEKTGQPIEFRMTDWNDTLIGLQNGEADIHSGLFRTPERSEWMAFSQPFYGAESGIFRDVDDEVIDTVKALAGQNVGAILGTQQAGYLKANFPELEIVYFSNNEELITALFNGKIRAFIGEIIPIRFLSIRLGMQGELNILKTPRYVESIFAGVRKDDEKLLELVDRGLNRITNKELFTIESRWIPDPEDRYMKSRITNIRLSMAEEDWIREHRHLRVGVGIAFPPFQYLENGEFKGIASDYIRILNERLGLSMEVVKDVSSWNDVLERAKVREIDVFACATETQDRKEYMNFTRPYLQPPLVIVTRKDAPFVGGIEDLKGKSIAIVKALATYNNLKEIGLEYTPVFVKTPPDEIQAVAMGNADAVIQNLVVASYLIQKMELANLKIAAPTNLPVTTLSFAARNDWHLLVDILNKGLDSITPEEHIQIRQKWVAVRYEHGISREQVQQWALEIGIPICVIVIMIILWNIQIRRSKERFRGLTEHGSDITQTVTQDGIIHYQSPSHTRILGYAPNELRGKSVTDLFHDEDICRWEKILESLSQKNIETFVHRFRHKQGDYRYFESHVVNLLDNKALRAVVINARDITERKQAEDALNQAYKALEAKAKELEEVNIELSQYTYVVSHDLRAPMRAIHNYADFIKEDLEGTLDAEQKMYLDGMCKAVGEANALINDLLELSRIGRLRTGAESIDVGKLLNELVKSLDLPSDAHVIIKKEFPVIEVEPIMLRQIFQNLITNAVKFNTSKEKIVEMDWEPVGSDAVEFSIKDNGIGIDPRFHQKVFRVFERLHTREEYDGTGIGLAIVKKAIKKMNGDIRLDSNLGQGSTFYLKFPKKQQELTDEQETLCDFDG